MGYIHIHTSDTDTDTDTDTDVYPYTDTYTIDRTWSWPVMSAAHPLPPSPSTVRSRDHTVLYCTIVLYSTKKRVNLLTDNQRTDRQASVSKTESTLILSGSSPDTRGSWPIILVYYEDPNKKMYIQ